MSKISNTALRGASSLIVLAAACSSALAQQAPVTSSTDPAAPEEIILTGSYLSSTSFQPSSPVDFISAEAMQSKPQVSISAALSELPYVTGGGFGQGGGQAGSTVNLRGLGASGTLVLLNGRRQARVPNQSSVVDVNTLVPEIMVGSVEVLKDGASALYGSDAVGGVVNFKTRRKFTGVLLQAQGRWQTSEAAGTPYLKSHPGNYRVGALVGVGNSQSNISAAFEYATRDRIGYAGMPGATGDRYVPVPLTNQLTGSRGTIVDPGCGSVVGTAVRGNSCLYDFWPDQTYLSDQKRYHGFISAGHEFSDSLKFSAELGWAKVKSRAGATASPSLSVSSPLIVPGESPAVQALGDQFRARNAAGALLYAQPNATNLALPARDGAGRVISVGTDSSLGIPYWDDVRFAGRVITSQGGLATGGNLRPGEFAHANPQTSTSEVFRFSTGFDGQLFEDRWNWSLFYTKAVNKSVTGLNDVLTTELRQALAGFGGSGCNVSTGTAGVGGCQYFNPFIGSAFASAGSGAANSQDVIDGFYKEVHNRYKTDLSVVDALITGEIFDLPAGPVGLALGGQYRHEKWNVDFAPNLEVGNTANATISRDIAASNATKSVFAELGVPVLDHNGVRLNLNGALRFEDSGNASTFDPKFGAVLSLMDDRVQLRGSWGTSFLAPSLYQKFTQSTGLVNLTSTYGGTRAPTAQPRIATIISGNENLDPQSATSWNLGLTVRPVSGLRMSVDYWNYRYEGLITQQNAQSLVTADDASLAAGTGPTGRVVRDALGNVLQVQTQFFNAASLETSGLDLQVAYSTSFEGFGEITADLNATYVDKYDFQASATANVLHAAGRWNDTNTSINPSVRWRALMGLSWTLDAHSVRASVNYTGGLTNDRALANRAGDETFDAFTTVDLNYTLDLEQLANMADTTIAIGVSNLFNAIPDNAAFEGNGLATGVYDYLGRSAWARLSVQF